ncbi:aspartyl protease family protein [Armatimonas sp.]|uniref:aspartyl protease family protein n=1 Tax=Armatimonas sp. TaxID=1872638 RepID=UPI00286D07CE|nr:aspartyl protease family protein [Armatimonas sp.]
MQTSNEISAVRQGNYLFVKARVGVREVVLCVDSGAGIHVLTPQAAMRLGLLPPDGATRNVTGTAATVAARQIRLTQLSIGGLSLADTEAVAVPLPSSLGCDGLLGYPLFSQRVVTLDYAANSLILSLPETFTPPSGAASLPLKIEGNIPQAQVELDGIACWMELDTGSSGEVDLNAPFVEKNKLRERYTKRIAMPTGIGVGGVSYGEAARATQLKLGPFALEKPLIKLSQQKSGADASERTAGRLGAEVLRRFTVTFDYGRKRLYLMPNAQLRDPFAFTTSGLLPLYENFEWRVFAVLPDSPASEAGVTTDDQILTVDGRSANKLNHYSLSELLRRPAGTKIPLQLRAVTGRIRRVNLILRELL